VFPTFAKYLCSDATRHLTSKSPKKAMSEEKKWVGTALEDEGGDAFFP